MIYPVSTVDGDGYITGGNVVVGKDGFIDESVSDESVYVSVDGRTVPMAIGNLLGLGSVQDGNAYRTARMEEIDRRYEDRYNAMTLPADPVVSEAQESGAADESVPNVEENAARVLGMGVGELSQAIPSEAEGLKIADRYENVGDVAAATAIREYVAERFGGNNSEENIPENGNNAPENIPTADVASPDAESVQEAVLSPAQQRKAKLAEIAQRIPRKGNKKLWTQAKAEDVAEYIATLSSDAAVQQAAVDKNIAGIREKQEKMDAIEALELEDDVAFWNDVKALLAQSAPAVAPVAENEQQPAAMEDAAAQGEDPALSVKESTPGVKESTSGVKESTSVPESQIEGENGNENQSGDNSEMVARLTNEVSKGETNIPQTEEVDEYGNHFVLASDGSSNFGVIDAESGLKQAPIKLSMGDNTVDENGNNHGYGLLHIEAERGDAIRDAGYNSVQEFVESVAKNYTDIREGGIIANNQTYLLELVDEHNNTLFIQLSKNGEYWTINSAGIFRKKYSRNKRKVYNRPALSSDTNTDTSGVDSGHIDGVTTPAGNSPQTSSTAEDTAPESNEQENSVKSGENTQNGGEKDVIEEATEQNRIAEEREQRAGIPPRPSDYSKALTDGDAAAQKAWEKKFDDFLGKLKSNDVPAIKVTINDMQDRKSEIKAGNPTGYKENPNYKAYDYIEKALKRRKRELEKSSTNVEKSQESEDNSTTSGEQQGVSERPNNETVSQQGEQVSEQVEEISFSKLKELFDSFNDDKYLAALFDRVVKIAETANVKIILKPLEYNIGGNYRASINTVSLNSDFFFSDTYGGIKQEKSKKAQTIVHELIHSVTAYAVTYDYLQRLYPGVRRMSEYQLLGENIPQNLKKAASELYNVFYEVRATSGSQVKFGTIVGFNNPMEFIAEIGKKDFREGLKTVGLWKRIVDGIKKFFRVANDETIATNALQETEAVLEELLSNFDLVAHKSFIDFDKSVLKAELQRGSLALDSSTPAFKRATEKTMQALEKTGIEVVMATEEQVRAVLGAEKQAVSKNLARLEKISKAIINWLKNNTRDRRFEITLPAATQRKVRNEMGRDFDSHRITANSVAHSKKNHGTNGEKNTDNSIPLRDEDFALIPYIMTAPDRVTRGSYSTDGSESVRFYKNLSNGYVVVVEKEQKNSPDDMETITMWAEISANVPNARNVRPSSTTSETVTISPDDVAKIRKDAENAIRQDVKLEKSRSVAPFYSNARRAVLDIKQEKATPGQWVAMLKKNGGLKAGEDAWIGLSEWIGKQEGTVSKQEILDYLTEHSIQIEEVEYSQFGYGLMDEAAKNIEAEAKAIGWDAVQEKYPGIEEYFEFYNGEILWSEERASIGEYEDFIIDNRLVDVNAADNAINETRERYTTEGLERKREIALTVPTIEPYNASDEVHFGDAGGGRAVAWVRFGETTDSEGKRVLVIDEIQSKRHQDGREKGYISAEKKAKIDAIKKQKDEFSKLRRDWDYRTGQAWRQFQSGEISEREYNHLWDTQFNAEKKRLDEIEKSINTEVNVYDTISKIPSAPFEKNWHELAMKRMLRYAAENGFDKVAWTTGEQQAERYDMSRQVESISVEENTIEDFSDGTPVAKNITISTTSGMDIRIDTDADGVIHGGEYGGKHLSDVVGKEFAERIMQPGSFTLEGESLRIGGEGMKGFYDRMLPSFVQKYTKKWGAKVGDVTMPDLKENNTMHSVDVTPAMTEAVMQGQPMFLRTSDGTVYGWSVGGRIYLTPEGVNPNTPVHEYTHLWASAIEQRNPELWAEVVEAMKQSPVWNEVMADEAYRDIWNDENRMASEVMARLSGNENYRRTMHESVERENDPAKKFSLIAAWGRVKRALAKFWNSVMEMLDLPVKGEPGNNAPTWERFVNSAIGDFYGGVNPNVDDASVEFAKKESARRREKNRINSIIDEAVGFFTVGGKKQATRMRLKREAERKQLAKEIYSSVLKGDFNPLTLERINKYIEDATPNNPFGRRISQRLPQRMERSLRARERAGAVDALFSRICESSVAPNGRFSEAGRRAIEERKKETLKGWAIASGNWHTDLKEFTNDAEPIGQGKDSKVYMSKDGRYVIKASKGKPYGKKFRPDIDNIPLFNDVFPSSRYEILGYGEIDGEFVRILKQPFVDFAQSTPLTSEERAEYMAKLGFKPLNKENTAFADGEIVIADLQKSNIVKDAEGNVRVIDADAKLHTKDVGGDYIYPSVETDLPQSVERMFIGEKGAENLDSAEEATTRLDNLAIAREMEAAEKDAKTIKLATGWERGADGKWRYETEDAKLKETLTIEGKEFKRDEMEMLWRSGKLIDHVDNPALFDAYPELANVRIETDDITGDSVSNGGYNPRTKTITIHASEPKYLQSILNHEIQHAIQHFEGFAKGGSPNDGRLYEFMTSDMTIRKLISMHQRMESEFFNTDVGKEVEKESDEWLDNHPNFTDEEATEHELYLLNKYPEYKSYWEKASQLPSLSKEIRKPKTKMEAYRRIAGEVESRNVQSRIGLSAEERRASLAAETEDVAREDQIFIYDNLGESAMVAESERQKPFHDMIDDLYSNGNVDKSKYARTYFHVAETPAFMENIGLAGAEFTIPFKAISTHIGKDADHKLTADIWHELPNALQHPFLVTKYGEDGRFRIYTTLLHNGKYVAVGVDVKRINQGRNKPIVEINSIKTVFAKTGRIGENETVVCYDERITPEQEALLDGRNFRQYPTIQELSTDKGSNNSSNSQEDDDIRFRSSDMYDIRRERAAKKHKENQEIGISNGLTEEQQIIERAKADGTYMKAPNGKDTNLSPKQWVQVRTEAFKKWFGDWMLAATETPVFRSKGTFVNLAAAEKWAKENLQGQSRVNKYTGEEISVSRKSVSEMLNEKTLKKSDSVNNHLAALQSVLDFIETGIPAEVHSDTHGRDFDVMRLYNAIEIDGKVYRVKSTVRKVKQGDKFYTYEVQEMELIEERGANPNREGETPHNGNTSNNSITGAKLLNGVKKTNSDEDILQYSKVVDENGEPKIVEHSTWNDDLRFRMVGKQKKSSDTATQGSPVIATGIPNDYSAKIQHLKEIYNNRPTKRTRGFITDVSKELGLINRGQSNYRTFTTPMGDVTLRISNHNSKLKEFNDRNEAEGISIVISQRKNKKIDKDNSVPGKTHLQEYFYSKQTLERAQNRPLVQILESIEDFLATGVYSDKTGIAHFEDTSNDIRYRDWYGGNSGYVGYSMSKRAAEAREEGRYPKTDFKKEYNMPQQTLDALVDAGVIDNSEWHHTSKHGNRTTFYGWVLDEYADIYAENKKEIDALAKEVNDNIAELEKEERAFRDSWKGYQYPETFDWSAYSRRGRQLEELPVDERMAILRSEFPETAEAEKHDSRQREFSSKMFDKKREQRKRIEDLFEKKQSEAAERVDAEITGAVNDLAAKLNTDVEIVHDVSTLPDARKRGSKGWYERGKVYVVLENADSVQDAVETVLHEVVGHKGLRALFGDRFNAMLDDVFRGASKDVRSAIIERALPLMGRGRGNAIRVATEEYMAEQAERGFDDYSLWSKVKGWFRNLLRSMGLDVEIGDNESNSLLWLQN